MITKKLLAVLVTLYVFGALLHLGRMYLHREEPRRCIIAMEMNYSGNYFVPHVLGRPYFKKPPLHNFVLAMFFKVFGMSEWSARIVSVLSMFAIMFAIFIVAKDIIGSDAALFSAFSFGLAFISYFNYGMLAETDMFFSLLVFASLVCIFKRRLFLGSVFTAFALLTKGFPALHYFYLTLFFYAWAKRELRRFLLSKETIFGAVFIFLTFFGWLLAVSKGNVHRFDLALGTLIQASGGRVLSIEKVPEVLKHIVKFPISFFLRFLPASILLFLLLKKDFLSEFKDSIKSDKKIKDLFVFSVTAFFPNFLIYWIIPDGRVRYTLVLFAVLSFVLGIVFYVYEFYPVFELKKIFKWFFGILAFFAVFTVFFDFEFVKGLDYYIGGIVFVLSILFVVLVDKINPESVRLIVGVVVTGVLMKLLYISSYNAYLYTYYTNYKEYGFKTAKIILSNHPKYVMTDGGNLRLFVYVEKYLGMQLHPISNKHGAVITRNSTVLKKIWLKLELPDHIYYVGEK